MLREQLQAAVDAWDACPEHERQQHIGGVMTLPGDWYAKLLAVLEFIAGTPDNPVRGCRLMLAALNAEYARAMGEVISMCEAEADHENAHEYAAHPGSRAEITHHARLMALGDIAGWARGKVGP